MDIIGLPGTFHSFGNVAWTEDKPDATEAYNICAAELVAALPKWTKFTINPLTWPAEGEQVLTKTGFSWFYGNSFAAWIGEDWRSLCSIDTPPKEQP